MTTQSGERERLLQGRGRAASGGPRDLGQGRGRSQTRSRSGRALNGVDVNQSHLTRHRMAVEGPDYLPDQVRHQLVADLLQTLPGGDEDIVASLDAVLLVAQAWCPSCVAVSLTVYPEDQPVTIATVRTNGHRHAPAMTVRLPQPSPNWPRRQPAVLVVFATDTVALTRLAADLTALLGIGPGRVTLAAAARVPQTATAGRILSEQLADRAAVDRALGVLLDQGWVSTERRGELQRRADDAGVSLAQAAATVLAALPGATPQRPS